MQEKKVNIQLKPSRKFVDADYFFEMLFWKKISKNIEVNYPEIAKQIFYKAAQRGDKGLFADGWREMIQELNVSPNQYFLTLRRLKQAGMIEKSKGRFYVSRNLKDHLNALAASYNRFLIDMGIN